MKYKVVRSSSPEGLEKKVQGLLDEGYLPLGGIQINVTRQQNRYSGSQHMDTINSLEYVQSVYKNEE